MTLVSGVCPTVKNKTTQSYSDTVPTRDTFDLETPTPAYTTCASSQITNVVEGPRDDGTSTEVIQCCPTPGPQGPTGPQGPAGNDGAGVPAGGTTGQILSKIDGTDYNTEWRDETIELPAGGTAGQVLSKIDGTDYNVEWSTPTDTAFTFAGKWADGSSYVVDDVITHNNSSYVCIRNHTASKGVNEPDLSLAEENKGLLDGLFEATGEFLGSIFGGDTTPPNDPSLDWVLLSKGEEEKKGILGGVFDWIKDIGNWDVLDYIGAVAAAVGIYVAGSEILDAFDFDPEATPEYDVKFNGDTGYIGAFTPPTLQNTITSIMDAAGVDNYDVASLPSREVHLTIRQEGTWRSLVELLSRAYQFDMISTFSANRRLRFQPRTNASVRTIGADEIGFKSGIEGDTPYVGKRMQGSDLPRSVEISYYSEGYSEKYLSQASYMRTYPQGQDVKISLPITLTDQEAKDLADLILTNAHTERNSYSFTTTLEHIDIEAGDVVTIEPIGDVRIQKVTTGNSEDGLVEFIATDAGVNITPAPIYDGPTIIGYTASINQASQEPPVTPDVTEEVIPIVTSGGFPLDLPPLDDDDREPRIHFACHNFGSSYDLNTEIYQSKDGGASYSLVGSSTTKSKWGKVASALPAPTNFRYIDEVNTITVQMKEGTLATVSEIDFYNGVNKCMLGQEMILFRDVSDLGGGTYQLSYLMRGKQGTDPYIDQHVSNELFVMLDDSLVEIPMQLNQQNVSYKYKVVSVGGNIASATARDFAPQFRNFYPWKVTNLTIVRDGGSGVFGARWLRRWKWDTDIVDGRSSLPDDDIGGYKVTVIDPGDDSIVNEYVVTAPSWSYSAAQQTEDFGSTQTTLKISVTGISKHVGPGHSTVGTYGI